MFRVLFILLIAILPGDIYGQYNWELKKEKNGIEIFRSNVPHSKIKAIKVHCTLIGDYGKLINVLSNIPELNEWVYNAKGTKMVESYSPLDFTYFIESSLPWPIADRGSVIHLKFNTDSLPNFMTIVGTGVPDMVPQSPDLIYVKNYNAKWKVTMPQIETIKIEYILELDPGGDLPAWLINMFAVKGPYETFNNLSHRLKD